MDFNATFQTWMNILTHPNEEAFETERMKPQANLTTALIWMVIAGIISGILGFIQAQMFRSAAQGMLSMMDTADMPPEAAAALQGMIGGIGGGAGLMSIILTPLFFLVFAGIVYFIARALGGQGEFGRYAYLLAGIQAPISILSSVLGFVPFLGGCLNFFLFIYGLVLAYFATKVEHGLTQGKAIITIIIPMLVVFALTACASLLIATLMAGFSG
ncbi:MAG: YIP1 family protein [Caldilineaceae bacterium]|nr:YIP1 family protein [Caldilineaceae bacterium]